MTRLPAAPRRWRPGDAITASQLNETASAVGELITHAAAQQEDAPAEDADETNDTGNSQAGTRKFVEKRTRMETVELYKDGVLVASGEIEVTTQVKLNHGGSSDWYELE